MKTVGPDKYSRHHSWSAAWKDRGAERPEQPTQQEQTTSSQLEGGTGFIFKPVFLRVLGSKNRLTVNDEAPLV